MEACFPATKQHAEPLDWPLYLTKYSQSTTDLEEVIRQMHLLEQSLSYAQLAHTKNHYF
jgi:hypothetical protein